MKLAILGDIHANSFALAVVLRAAKMAEVDALLITGDYVGYYFSPKEVIELLRPWKKFMVRGNHEEMLKKSLLDWSFRCEVLSRYGSGIELAINQLSSNEIHELCNLPHPLMVDLDFKKILICHGSPNNIDSYIYPDSNFSSIDCLEFSEFDLIVAGHSHYPMLRSLSGGGLFINPGSVGQPRNSRPGAHWALYDTKDATVSFHCESYDYIDLQIEARNRHPELPYLADILGRK